MIRRKFPRASLIVTAMTLFATSLTASVCSADDVPETESLGTPPAIATTTAAAAAPAKTASAPKAAAAPKSVTATRAATPTPVLTAAITTIESPPIAAPTAAAPAATPLQLRESHPIELAPEPASNSLWKLGAILALMGAGAYALKRHNEKNKPVETIRSLQVLKKLSIGVRTELIVVDVDGQRLLLGVTPSSIQTLASLPDPEPMEMQEPEQLASATRISPTYRPAPETGERSLQLGERLAALVEKSSRVSDTDYPVTADLRPDLRVTARPQRRTSKKPGPTTEPPEGQARGLAKIGRI